MGSVLKSSNPAGALWGGALWMALLIGPWAGEPATAEAGILEVRPVGADALPEGTAEKARAVKGVATVERYLLVKA